MTIRQETENDCQKVYEIIKTAFETAEHCDGNEQDLANSLRKSTCFIPELSLVAEIDGHLAGHIMFTKGFVGNDIVLVLAPLSVSPRYQNQGVGASLITESHKIAKKLGYEYSLVLGNDKYYARFGYVPAEKFDIEVPEGIPSHNFMAIRLSNTAQPIKGVVTYAKEFGM